MKPGRDPRGQAPEFEFSLLSGEAEKGTQSEFFFLQDNSLGSREVGRD